MSSSIYHLVYTSRAVQTVTEPFIQKILGVARDRNNRDDITGFLVARGGYFLQLLEGPEIAVKTCFSRIMKDPRHSQISLQAEARSDERIMKDWSMAQVELTEASSSSESLIHLIEDAKEGVTYKSKNSILTLLKKFAQDAKLMN